MSTAHALSVIEHVRTAGKAMSAYRAARQSMYQSQEQLVTHLGQHGSDCPLIRSGLAEAPSRACHAVQQNLRKAEARLQRAAATLQRHRPTLHRYPAERDRQRVTALLLDRLADRPVDLVRAADLAIVQTSAGKDSVVALHRTVAAAKAANSLHKVRVMHCDLGEAEWPGVRDLARRQAERYRAPFLAVTPGRGFLGLVENRQQWPDAKRRLCTSTLKRDPTGPVITTWVKELGLDRQAVVLNVMGIRGKESDERARKPRLTLDNRTSSANRLVLTWHIVHQLSERDIWQEIATHNLEYHPIYDAGLPRLSCVYCVLAGADWLILATRVCFALDLPQPEIYAALERRIGHSFKHGYSLNAVIAAARMLDALDGPITWRRGDALRRHLGPAAANRYLAARGHLATRTALM